MCELLRRRAVLKLGVSRYAFDEMVKAGSIQPVHLKFDDDGRPTGRAYYRRSDVERVTGLKLS